MSTFFAMGGYGAFIWPSYAATAVVLGTAIVLSLYGHSQARSTLRRLEEESGEEGI